MAALTFEKFVELLKNFDRKHELVMGEVADMGDVRHWLMAVLSAMFLLAFTGPCRSPHSVF